jgi:predicted nucleic acid-binding protein
MILVDSPVWVDHLRAGDGILADLLDRGEVACHPFVIGELALGNLHQRGVVIKALRNLPKTLVASDAEVHILIERQKLFGAGIGYVDAHLLAATLVTTDVRLWTRDKRLNVVAERLGVAANRDH